MGRQFLRVGRDGQGLLQQGVELFQRRHGVRHGQAACFAFLGEFHAQGCGRVGDRRLGQRQPAAVAADGKGAVGPGQQRGHIVCAASTLASVSGTSRVCV